MRKFDYQHLPSNLFSSEISSLVSRLHEDKGKMGIIESIYPGLLESLRMQTRLDNVDASTRIEGIYLGIDRTRELLAGSSPHNDDERQTVGYARVLDKIDGNYDDVLPEPGTMVELHKDFFAGVSTGLDGKYRRKDYVLVDMGGQMERVPVSPIKAFETPLVLGGICDTLIGALEAGSCSPLILIPVFTVDFLCTRPFEEGNGRMSRLIDQLLLLRSGFDICRYASVDRLFEQDAIGYYDALNACVIGWDRASNDYTPFVTYWLKALCTAYEHIFDLTEVREGGAPSKSERVRLYFESHQDKVTKRELLETFPDISEATVEAALGSLVKEGLIRKMGAGPATGYLRMD